MLSHNHQDEWLTPPEILDRLGKFDLDPCSPTIRPWPTARFHFTRSDNGLEMPWFGRVWCNPPYSLTGNRSQVEFWMQRMAAHGNGMALVNSNTETQWFFNYLWNAAHALLFFEGKIAFYNLNGTRGRTGWSGSVIAAYSANDAKILHGAGFKGKFIPLIIQLAADLRHTWRQVVQNLMVECGGTATLDQLYKLISGHPKTLSNPNWKAKIRQTVQKSARRIGPALYANQSSMGQR